MLLVAVSLIPVSAHAETFNVLLDKTALMRLKHPAAVVLIGNPEIADVTIRSSKFILVHGRSIGETNLIILDGNDREVATYDIVVSPQGDRRVTVSRSVELETMSCNPRCTVVANPAGRNVGTDQTAGDQTTDGDTGLSEGDAEEEGATN